MTILQALVLGVLQGLTEFLPISSSGHLVVFPFIVGWEEPTVAFVVATHLGTLTAVAWVFRERLASLARTVVHWKSAAPAEKHLIVLLAIGTLPAGIVGATIASRADEAFSRPAVASLFLGVTGWLLFSVESRHERRVHAGAPARVETELRARDAALIGVAQAAAILPGISRSGSTVGAGMVVGLDRGAAARFSFVLSVPVIAGAGLVEVPAMLREGTAEGFLPFLVGFLAAAVSGALAIRWFLGIIERRTLRGFGVYCFVAMTAGLLTALARG